MIRRPNPQEDDDELLRQQEEFFKNVAADKVKPAAIVHNPKVKNHENTSESSNAIDVREQIANTFEAIPTDMKLDKVSEKRTKLATNIPLTFDRTGFPKALRRDPDIKPSKGSIFSQHIKRIKKETTIDDDQMTIDHVSLTVKENRHVDETVPCTSGKHKLVTVLSETDYEQIHDENVKKIKMMSEEDIKAERDRIISTMDPAIVEYLRSRKKEEKNQTRNPTIQEQNADIDFDELETPAEVLGKPEAETWLNFNKIETNKLAWMKNVDVPKIAKDEPFEARFDFDGYLLPYSQENIDDTNRILYHHGEEPGRPGYTLQELLQLCRSNINQQKIVALNTLSNVLALHSTGIYDNVFDPPVEQIFFVLRFCLDDNAPAILNACVKAVRNLIYFQLDETCLDNSMSFGVGVVQPVLGVDRNLEDDSTVNDQQLVETDLIKCLIRTNILTRIRYIINTVRPPLETIIYCLEILIRLARDSQFAVNKMFACESLFSSLIRHFLPHPKQMRFDKSNPGYNTPLVHMVKLLRVLSARKKTIAENLLKRYNLMEIVTGYLYEEKFSENANGMRLQIECMHYWSLLLHYNLPNDLIRPDEPLLWKHISYHFHNTDNLSSTTLIRQSHVAALFLLIGKLVQNNRNVSDELHDTIGLCVEKWITQFRYVENLTCGQSQIISAILNVCTVYSKRLGNNKIDTLIDMLIRTDTFSEATRNIKNGSMILNNFDTHKTSANLKSLEAAAWFTMDHIVPVMQRNSCIPFLYNLSGYVVATKSSKLKMQFLSHPNIDAYVKDVQCSDSYFNTGNWFTRCEAFFIMNILKIGRSVRKQLNASVFFDVAVKCLCVFTSEQKADIKSLLNTVVFSVDFYPIEAVLENTRIVEGVDSSVAFLDDIKRVYAKVLALENLDQNPDSFSIDVKVGNLIPVDWIYAPIMSLKVDNKLDKTDVVLNCLRWILIYETHFPNLAASVSPAEKYCRLSFLFLDDDNFFLHSDIGHLMECNFKNLMKYEKDFDFRQEISGLTNFQDFYTQLLEQYQSVSYGSKLFGNVILIPLVRRHNVQYRKTLWSEYFGVVEVFNVTPSESWIPLEQFITPPEEDVSLLMCYRRALHNPYIRNKSILYSIAEHHKSEATKVCQY